MNNRIVLIDEKQVKPLILTPERFSDLDVKERQDLEEWIKATPDVLGTEPKLLIITSEYDRFDKSDKRLDLLAIDSKKKLVIIELKLDAKGTLADLQAIRYAAFCSRMTFQKAVGLFATHAGIGVEEATETIKEFVDDPDFAALDNQPRIILAAGTFGDPEITSCVLWLRSFNVDISCVELTPYRLPDDRRIVLVPRVIIPLPEAKEYIVGIENKEAEQGRPRATVEDLLRIADNRGVRPLVDACRLPIKDALDWQELPGTVYGGSLTYWVPIQNFTRSVFGINVACQRSKDAPSAGVDVWIPTKNLADKTGVDETTIRAKLAGDYQVIEQGKDCVLRLSTLAEAEHLVNQLKEWSSGAMGLR